MDYFIITSWLKFDKTIFRAIFLHEHTATPLLGKVKEHGIIGSYAEKVIIHFPSPGFFLPRRMWNRVNVYREIIYTEIYSLTGVVVLTITSSHDIFLFEYTTRRLWAAYLSVQQDDYEPHICVCNRTIMSRISVCATGRLCAAYLFSPLADMVPTSPSREPLWCITASKFIAYNNNEDMIILR